jgi:hypothetical protein
MKPCPDHCLLLLQSIHPIYCGDHAIGQVNKLRA